MLAAWWTSHLELDWQEPALRDFVETLAQRHTVVRYDRPGVGLSSRGDRPYDLDSETDYLNAVIDAARSDQRDDQRDDQDDQVDLLGVARPLGPDERLGAALHEIGHVLADTAHTGAAGCLIALSQRKKLPNKRYPAFHA